MPLKIPLGGESWPQKGLKQSNISFYLIVKETREEVAVNYSQDSGAPAKLVLKGLIAGPLPSHQRPGLEPRLTSPDRPCEVEAQPGGLVRLVTAMQPVVTVDFLLTNVQLSLHVFCHCLDFPKGST